MNPETRRIFASPFGDTLTWITGEDATHGAYSLHERVAPPGAKSPAHSHGQVVESFYVLEGELEFRVGDELSVGRAGSFVLAPMGVTHAWRNVNDAPARVLVMFTPSAQRAYFEALDALTRAGGGKIDGRALLALSEEYGWA